MPFLVQLTDDAARDLEEICDYIEQHDAPGKANHPRLKMSGAGSLYVLVIADGRRDMQTLLQRRLLQV